MSARVVAESFCLILPTALVLSLVSCHHGESSARAQQRTEPTLTAATSAITLAFVGDILLDDLPGRLVADGTDPFEPMAPWLGRAALTIGNLECSIAEVGTAVNKMYTFRAHPRAVGILARHFDAVSLANNHTGDYGTSALSATMSALSKARVSFFGAGPDLVAAHEPHLFEVDGVRIALLGYSEYHPRTFEATPTTPGIAWSEEEQVLRDILRARKLGARVVIPFFHWGWENERTPCARQLDLARRAIDGGADAVIGSHPHGIQGAEIYRDRPIIYSLGNFLFNLNDNAWQALGWLLRLDIDASGVDRWDTLVLEIDERGVPFPNPRVQSPCGKRGLATVGACVPQLERTALSLERATQGAEVGRLPSARLAFPGTVP